MKKEEEKIIFVGVDISSQFYRYNKDKSFSELVDLSISHNEEECKVILEGLLNLEREKEDNRYFIISRLLLKIDLEYDKIKKGSKEQLNNLIGFREACRKMQLEEIERVNAQEREKKIVTTRKYFIVKIIGIYGDGERVIKTMHRKIDANGLVTKNMLTTYEEDEMIARINATGVPTRVEVVEVQK